MNSARAIALRIPLLKRGVDYLRDRAPHRCLRHPDEIQLHLATMGRHRTFMQIGSNDGVTHDTIHRYVRWGRWRGVVVEPSPAPFSRLARNYRSNQRVIAINAAVAERAGTADFFYVEPRKGDPWWTDQIGSFSREHVAKHTPVPDLVHRIRERTIDVRSFADVCRQAGLSHVDLVHLDVEGFDAQLLGVLPYDQFHVGAVIFEHTHMTPNEHEQVAAHLSSLSFIARARSVMDELWVRP